jgi:FkbM family methyltransferase
MPSLRRLAHVLLDRHVPARTRLDLLTAEARRRTRPKPEYSVRYGNGRLFLSHDDYAIDRETLKWVLVDRAYESDYADAVVVDIGAHKGYFGAYAFEQGARAVISFEPEEANLELLERSAASYRQRGLTRQVHAAAVGAARGEAELHVMSASWGHALHPPNEFSRWEVGVQRVAVVSIADSLAEARALSGPGSRLVVKVNVEGEECGIVLGTEPSTWQSVSELFVETHPWADCTATELAEHLAPVGLKSAPSAMAQVLRLRPAAAPRSGPRSPPR